jgi:hypothetical protein
MFCILSHTCKIWHCIAIHSTYLKVRKPELVVLVLWCCILPAPSIRYHIHVLLASQKTIPPTSPLCLLHSTPGLLRPYNCVQIWYIVYKNNKWASGIMYYLLRYTKTRKKRSLLFFWETVLKHINTMELRWYVLIYITGTLYTQYMEPVISYCYHMFAFFDVFLFWYNLCINWYPWGYCNKCSGTICYKGCIIAKLHDICEPTTWGRAGWGVG